jgi:hypothetical protein
MTIEFVGLMPKIYINSFPKSGTHLALLVTLHLAKVQKPHYWLGSFSGNSFTTDWFSLDNILPVIQGQQPGTWMMGHMGYKPEIEEAFIEAGTCMLFVYRDLRDTAVSQAYHIENPDDKRFRHPNKAAYMELESHEERIKAVITGLNGCAGIIERWELYAPWLDCDWVLPIRYEEMRNEPDKIAEKVLDYIVGRTMGDEIAIVFRSQYLAAIQESIKNMITTDKSVSFRAGRIGDWREEFTPEILELFNSKSNGWIERLGYE